MPMLKPGILGKSVSTNELAPLARPDWLRLSSASCPWCDSFKVEHHRRFPKPVVSFFLFWLGYILNGAMLPF